MENSIFDFRDSHSLSFRQNLDPYAMHLTIQPGALILISCEHGSLNTMTALLIFLIDLSLVHDFSTILLNSSFHIA